ncbi:MULTISPECIES: site-specific DNA-methyltransferase [Hyphobacterium]|uniref:Methyltransferase n=1 Tax=Hyphobacterium vulgare TaxID=1736751 RepID=A0ABV6ZVK5_9PROT
MKPALADSRLIDVDFEALRPFPNHARKHDRAKARSLTRSIDALGLVDPIIIDENNVILSGHLRVTCCQKLGHTTIPAIRVTHLKPHEKRVFVIAANRFPERGGWDRELLQFEVSQLLEFADEIDIEATGFEIPEVDMLLADDPDQQADSSDDDIPDPPSEPVTQPGDLWALGDHRVLCGSSLLKASWDRLMDGDKAGLCITDPPYNVRIKGHVTSKRHSEFAMASGEMSAAEFNAFLQQGLGLAAAFSHDGALHFIAMDHRHMRELYAAADPIYSEQLNLIVWAKTNAGMGSFYRSRHELFALFKVGAAAHVNNVQLGRFGRNRSNVWTYPGANTFRKGRDKDLADHPTIKPVQLLADAILDASRPGDIVIDGFGGSGSIILAAERTQRRARIIEIEPKYVDVAIARWTVLTGKQARLLNRAEPLALPAPTPRLTHDSGGRS